MITIPALNAEVHRLDNGLEVLLLPEATHALVSVQLWVRAGSIHEEAWSGAGLAHLVEHMFFKGTKTRDAIQISQEIQRHGGYVNAYTTYNRTVYWIDGLAESASKFIEILGDIALNSLFDPAELKKEQEVIRREFAMDLDDPQSVLQHLLQETAFREHPLKHPIIGHLEIFNQVTHEDLMQFIRKHYVPNQCFLVITGDIKIQEILEQVEKSFGEWQRKPYAPVCFPSEPEQFGLRSASKRFNTEITRLSWGWRIGGENHPDRPALEILGMILGTGRSSRLTQRLREELGIVNWIGAGPWCIEPFGLFGVEAECEESDLAQVEQELVQIIEEVRRNGVRHSELEKAVRHTLSQVLKSRGTVRGLASSLGQSWLHQGSVDAERVYLEKLSRLTPEDIQDVAVKYLIPEKLTQVTLLPEEDEEDSSVQTKSLAVKNGEISLHVLSNGWRVVLGKKPSLPLISTRIQFMAGLTKELPETLGLTQVTAQWLLKGTDRFSSQELASALEDRGGNLFATGDLQRLVLGADCMKGDEWLGWELLSSMIGEPTLPAEELPKIIKRQIAALQEDEEDPLTLALHQTREKIFQGGAYEKTAIGTRESLKNLNRQLANDFLTKLVDPAHGVISVFGDLDEDTTLTKLEQWFGGLSHSRFDTLVEEKSGIRGIRGIRGLSNSQRKIKGLSDSNEPISLTPVEMGGEPGSWRLELDKEQAVIVVGFRSVGFAHADAPALQLLEEACSDMGSRLFSRIREDLGLAYYVGAQAFHALGDGAFYFYVGTDPEKLDLVKTELRSLITDLYDEGLTQNELESAKRSALLSWCKGQQNNGSMADALGWDELNGFGYRHFEKVPQILDNVSVEMLHDVIRKYIDWNRRYEVIVSP